MKARDIHKSASKTLNSLSLPRIISCANSENSENGGISAVNHKNHCNDFVDTTTTAPHHDSKYTKDPNSVDDNKSVDPIPFIYQNLNLLVLICSMVVLIIGLGVIRSTPSRTTINRKLPKTLKSPKTLKLPKTLKSPKTLNFAEKNDLCEIQKKFNMTSLDKEKLANWLQEQLYIAESKNETQLIHDLLEVLETKCPSDYEKILKKRNGELQENQWLLAKNRVVKLNEILEKYDETILGSGKSIACNNDEDIDFEVFYEREGAEMTFILKAKIRGISLTSISSLLAEIALIPHWIPLGQEAELLDTTKDGSGYAFSINTNFPAPFPKRGLILNQKIDSDFWRPEIPSKFEDEISHLFQKPKQGFHIWVESVSEDSPKILETLPKMKDFRDESGIKKIFVRRVASCIKALPLTTGKPEVEIILVASATPFGPYFPNFMTGTILKFIGNSIFKQSLRDLVFHAKNIDKARQGETSEWELAAKFADCIESKPIYKWMSACLNENFRFHA